MASVSNIFYRPSPDKPNVDKLRCKVRYMNGGGDRCRIVTAAFASSGLLGGGVFLGSKMHTVPRSQVLGPRDANKGTLFPPQLWQSWKLNGERGGENPPWSSEAAKSQD